MSAVLEIDGLRISLPRQASPLEILRGVDLHIAKGEVLGLVGESGCGKSITALACLGLLPVSAVVEGSIAIEGTPVTPASVRSIRGSRCAMIFQDPTKALNPYFTIGRQLTDVIRLHMPVNTKGARAQGIEALEAVRIPDAALAMSKYPHQMSGGQLQRVMIAMALACEPALLVADEPTTALDVTVQAQIISLLRELARERDLGVLFITHDLGVVAALCDRVAVMYSGEIVEQAHCADLFAGPLHPYTEKLLATVPRLGRGRVPLVHIPGQVPPLDARPSGCTFNPRCDRATAVCSAERPDLRVRAQRHPAACHHPLSMPQFAETTEGVK